MQAPVDLSYASVIFASMLMPGFLSWYSLWYAIYYFLFNENGRPTYLHWQWLTRCRSWSASQSGDESTHWSSGSGNLNSSVPLITSHNCSMPNVNSLEYLTKWVRDVDALSKCKCSVTQQKENADRVFRERTPTVWKEIRTISVWDAGQSTLYPWTMTVSFPFLTVSRRGGHW